MIILAFDSTAKTASCAVCDDEKLLGLYTVDNGLTQSELLLPMAENLLKSLHLTFSDVELMTASVGPGSFTGVRIGVSLIKGLAFNRRIPCVAVSTLEALAENLSGLKGLIVPCMDARREQIYTASFHSNAYELKRLCPDRAISIKELCEELKAYTATPIYISGDGYKKVRDSLIASGLKIESTPDILILENAYSVARIAIRKYKAGEYTDDLSLAPRYLRMPQAERERLERIKETD